MQQHKEAQWTMGTWFRELVGSPLIQNGGYFERLAVAVESSAPVLQSCSCPQ